MCQERHAEEARRAVPFEEHDRLCVRRGGQRWIQYGLGLVVLTRSQGASLAGDKNSKDVAIGEKQINNHKVTFL